MSDVVPHINPCSACTCGKGGAPSEFVTRKAFHDKETLDTHMGRRGFLGHAITAEANAARKDHQHEAFPGTNADDFRVQCTVGQNATGWQHPPNLDDETGGKKLRELGVQASMIESQRKAMIDATVDEWNAKNPVR